VNSKKPERTDFTGTTLSNLLKVGHIHQLRKQTAMHTVTYQLRGKDGQADHLLDVDYSSSQQLQK